MSKNIFLVIISLLLFTNKTECQNLELARSYFNINSSHTLDRLLNYGNNSTIYNNTLNIENNDNKKTHLQIGCQIGSHSSNLNQGGSALSSGIFFDMYLKFNLSNEVYPIVAFTYWKSKSNEINTINEQIPAETINSRGLKLGLDFLLIKMYNVSFFIGPSISIDKISIARNTAFSLGADLKLNLPLWNDKVNLLTTISYKNGAEAFEFGGNGIKYSFISYSLGLEISLKN